MFMLDISRYPIKPKKKLDQYFLINERYIHKEVELLGLEQGDVVLEVGPGLGFLTRELAKKARVIAIEKDPLLVNILKMEMPSNVEVIEGDALKIDLSNFGFNKFASNIPYSISRELTVKLLRTDFDIGAIICQDEFARKLVSRPGKDGYRAVSVIAQYYADISLHDIVPKSAYRPIAPVNSRIVLFKKKNPANLKFEEFVKSAFSRRRKVLWNGKRPDKMSVDEFVEAFKSLAS